MNPSGPLHTFHAVAFVENLSLKDLAPSYPEARRTVHELSFVTPAGGIAFIYPFGVMVFYDVPAAQRDQEMTRLHRFRPGLTAATVKEEFTVREDSGVTPDVINGVLTIDMMNFERASVVALTVAQSAAMEYYERMVETMFDRTRRLVDRLEERGTTPLRTGPLHRFIGEAVGTRNEVISVLHLLDKPDAAWDDPAMDAIYEDLRDEFDLGDRYNALELKLRGRTGVRLDSGNLLELTNRARRLLDAERMKHVRIFVSGGLDEFQIDDLVRGGAPIDAFGVGTRMGVSADQPYLDTAYKLVDYAGRPVMKLATGKVTAPGRKQVYRRRKPFGDVIGLFEEAAPSGMEALLQPMMMRGRRTRAPAGVADSRALCEADIAELPAAVRRIRSPRGLVASTTEKLQHTTEETRERLLSRFGPKRS